MIPMRVLVPILVAALAAPALGAQATATVARPPGPLTLQAAIELGRSRGVQAALARQGERLAEARVGQRRADLLPSVGANASYSRQTLNLDEFGIAFAGGVTDPFDLFKLQVHANQSLVDLAAWQRLRAARDSAVAAGLDTRNAGALAGAAAGVAWLRVLSAEETVRAREADSVTALSLLGQARQLLAAGVTAAIDLTRSDVTYNAIRSQLAVARNQRDRARLDLARSLDLPPGDPLPIAVDADSVGLPVMQQTDSAVRFALAHRPDLTAERKRLQVLGATRRAIRAENLPSLGANGSWQESGRETSTVKSTWLFQVGVTIPILDGFRRQSRSAEQEARIASEEIRVRDLASQVEADARQALLDLHSAEEQVVIARERERLARQELAQAQDRFAAGVAGSLETSNAQLSLTAALDAAIQARVAYGIAKVGALRALGILGGEQ
jgi:outer membrane protein TolC